MPAVTLTLGDVEAVAIRDVDEGSMSLSDVFGDEDAPGGADSLPERYPEEFGPDTWRFRDHCFFVRSPGGVALIDTGIGPEDSASGRELGLGGRLPEELAAIGAAPADVDHVIITHVHTDHIGWNTVDADRDPTPRFPNARYHVHEADWNWAKGWKGNEARAEFERVLAPLERSGQLSTAPEDAEIMPGLRLLYAPGHTPGHRCALLSVGDEHVLFAGDLLHFSFQLDRADYPSPLDEDRQLGVRTRVPLLDRADAEGLVLASAHLLPSFGRIVSRRGERSLEPA